MSLIYNNPDGIRRLVLISGDVILGISAFYSAFYLRFNEPQMELFKHEPLFLKVLLFVFILIASSFVIDLYTWDKFPGKKETVSRAIGSAWLSFFVLSALYYLIPGAEIGRGVLALSLSIFCFLQGIWHVIYDVCLNLPGLARRVLIFGTGPSAEKIGSLIVSTNHHHILAGYVNCTTDQLFNRDMPARYEGIIETARREKVHKIVISMTEKRGTLPLRDFLRCKLSGIDVLDAPSFYEQVTGKLLIEDIRPSWFIFSDGFKITTFKRFYKRLLDIVFSFIGLIMTLPFYPLIALTIKSASSGPVFFRQIRVGEREKPFTLYKFRTMREDAESTTGPVWAQAEDPRVTGIGKFMRKMRIDEIPQLFNVLRGDMSFIGPRPERPEFVGKLNEIIPYYCERHFVKPGITGWAQIKYPYGASVDDAIEKLRYDLYYIKHLSLLLDLLIVLETVKVVLFGRGGR